MSLLSVNQLSVMLSADGIAVLSRIRGLHSRVIHKQHVSIINPSEQNTVESANWKQATNQLDSMLASMQVKPKGKLHITLASDLVRYLALPAQKILMNPTEKLGYALAAYREIYGDVVSGWEVRIQDAPAHQVTMVAAIDQRLLEMLTQISLKYALTLTSVQPYFMCAFNSLTAQLGKINGYLVILESKRILLINLYQGNCQNLRIYVIENDWQMELKNLMMRELLLSESIGRDILVYAPTQKSVSLDSIEGWHVRRISPLNKNILNEPAFAMLEAVL